MILLEGIRNLALPCTLALAVPTVVAVLVARLRPVAAVGLVAGAGVAAWAQAVGWVRLGRGRPVELVLAVLLAIGFATLAVAGRRREPTWSGVLGVAGAVVGGLTATLWEPCVGPLLGQTLTAAPRDPSGTLLPMLLFATGALLPLWLLAGVGAVVDLPRLHARAARVGIVGAVVLVGVLGVGLWREAVSALVRATLA